MELWKQIMVFFLQRDIW